MPRRGRSVLNAQGLAFDPGARLGPSFGSPVRGGRNVSGKRPQRGGPKLNGPQSPPPKSAQWPRFKSGEPGATRAQCRGPCGRWMDLEIVRG